MINVLYVALGGAIGASLRYGINEVMNRYGSAELPIHTLIANLIGSLLLGYLFGLFMAESGLSNRLHLFLATGLLGAFTTFSTFSVENMIFIQEGRWGHLLGYVIISTVGGILLALAGFKLSGASIHA